MLRSGTCGDVTRFSALQRAEIAEIRQPAFACVSKSVRFSALQRAEIAEIPACVRAGGCGVGFSALQRAEIAEIRQKVLQKGVLQRFQCSSTSRNC